MAAFATTVIIIGANTPWTGVEHLVAVGVADVGVENLLRQATVQQEELGVVMVTAQHGGRLGIEERILDDELLGPVAPTVVPNDSSAIT